MLSSARRSSAAANSLSLFTAMFRLIEAIPVAVATARTSVKPRISSCSSPSRFRRPKLHAATRSGQFVDLGVPRQIVDCRLRFRASPQVHVQRHPCGEICFLQRLNLAGNLGIVFVLAKSLSGKKNAKENYDSEMLPHGLTLSKTFESLGLTHRQKTLESSRLNRFHWALLLVPPEIDAGVSKWDYDRHFHQKENGRPETGRPLTDTFFLLRR